MMIVLKRVKKHRKLRVRGAIIEGFLELICLN